MGRAAASTSCTVSYTHLDVYKRQVIYTRHTYNARGQLTKTQTDAGNAATTMAPTLWEYDAFGNKTKETWNCLLYTSRCV